MTRILITGAAGAVGGALLQELGQSPDMEILATDLGPPAHMPDNASFERLDVTGDDADMLIGAFRPEIVVHLASIVTPGAGSTPDLEYAVDVGGSRHVLTACVTHNVRRLIVTSSGAAYGYHPENISPLTEDAPVRGNEEFPYARHKRLVEDMLAQARADHPGLEQVVLRVGTVLSEQIDNQITALFRKPRMLRVSGTDGAFVFIWIDDLARILARAAGDGPAGIYNVAGTGALPIADLAAMMGKPVRSLPGWLLRAALHVARPLGLSRYGPEQVGFLEYRPVLDNTRLIRDFGYTPQHTSAQAFARWWQSASNEAPS